MSVFLQKNVSEIHEIAEIIKKNFENNIREYTWLRTVKREWVRVYCMYITTYEGHRRGWKLLFSSLSSNCFSCMLDKSAILTIL